MLDWPKAGVDGWRDVGAGFLERPKPGCKGVVERVAKYCPWSSTAPARSRSRSRGAATTGAVELRDELPTNPHRVLLSPGTVADIEDEIDRAFHAFDGRRVESGGLLLGAYRSQLWPPRTLVVRATGPGVGSEHSRSSLRMAARAIMAEQPEHMFELGHWHSEPTAGDGPPSEADLECWRGYLEDTFPAPVYVSVIARPRDDGNGWTCPVLRAWATWKSYEGQYICQRADLIEE